MKSILRSLKYKIDCAWNNQNFAGTYTMGLKKQVSPVVKKEIWDNVDCPQHLAPVYFRLHEDEIRSSREKIKT